MCIKCISQFKQEHSGKTFRSKHSICICYSDTACILFNTAIRFQSTIQKDSNFIFKHTTYTELTFLRVHWTTADTQSYSSFHKIMGHREWACAHWNSLTHVSYRFLMVLLLISHWSAYSRHPYTQCIRRFCHKKKLKSTTVSKLHVHIADHSHFRLDKVQGHTKSISDLYKFS